MLNISASIIHVDAFELKHIGCSFGDNMSNEEVVCTVLEGIAKVKDYIDYIDKEICLKKSSDEETKEVINKLFILSKAVKDKFDDYYNNKQKQSEESQTDKSVPNNVPNGLDSSVCLDSDRTIAEDNIHADNAGDQSASNGISPNDIPELMDSPEDETTTSEEPTKTNDKNKKNPLETEAEKNDKLSDTSSKETAVEETTVGKNNKNKENPLTTQEETAAEQTSVEKNKNKKNKNKGDPLTTQEESVVEETTVEKDNKNKEDSPTTQEEIAVEETTAKKDNKSKEDSLTTQEESVVEETTVEEDSLASDGAEKGNRTEKEDNSKSADVKSETEPPRIRLVDLNKLIDPNIRRNVQFDSSVIVLSSSDEENSVPQLTNTKNTKTNSKKPSENVDNKSKADKNSTKRKDKNSKVSVNLDNEAEIKISDSESDSSSRKSKRLKAVEKDKVLAREGLRAKFKRPSKATNKKSTADKSDGSSSDSDHGKSKTSKRTNVQLRSRSNDGKLNSKVYVPLPLYECHKMKEVFNRNKESFAVLSFEKLRLLRKSKRGRKSPGDSSSDTEKSRKKKSKTTVKSDDSHDEGESSKTTRSKKSTKDLDAEVNDDKSGSKKSGKKDKTDNDSEEENQSNKDKKTGKATTTDKNVESGEDKSSKKSVKIREDDSDSSTQRSKRKKNKNTVKSGEDSDEDIDTKKNKNNSKNQSEDDKTMKKGGKNQKATDAEDEEESKKKTKAKKGSTNNSDVESVDGDKKSQKDADSDSPSGSSKNGDKKKKNKNSDVSEESEDDDKVKEKNNKSDETDSEEKKSKKHLISSDESDADTSVKKVTNKFSDSEQSDEDEMKKKTITLDSSDSDDDFAAKQKEKTKKESSKKKKVKIVLSDSDDSDTEKKAKRQVSNSEESDNSDASKKSKKSSDEETTTKLAARKRIRNAQNSSSDSDEEVSTRRNIRKVLGKASLSATTKQAEAEEKERKARIAEKQKKYNRIFEEKKDATIEQVVLDYDEKTKEPVLEVHKKIVKNLKPHQVSGIQFMYDACFESLERIKNSAGSGCILAHCMGLGKTLQVISLTHTLLNHSKKTKVEKVMVVCPINTVLNWKSEYKKWMPSNSAVDVYELATSKKNYDRAYVVQNWHEDGGVLIIGYNLFRLLSNPTNKKLTKKMRTTFLEGLVDPGPDLVICDEGHLLKNEKTNLSIAMNRIKTLKRIVLTGTPLQNNLKEYWCMVQFIKPNLLGSYKEYMNRFVNPITNGQYTDSTQHDIQLMRKRSHVLHKLLDGVVQRRDYSVLEPYLPPKYEYVLFLKLSDVQIKIYKCYMEKYARKNEGSTRTSFLFNDFQQLQRICTHPRVLLDKSIERKEKSEDEDSEGSLRDFIDDDEDSIAKSTSSSSESGSESDGSDSGNQKKKPTRSRVTRARAAQKRENGEEDSEPEVIVENKEWFQEFCDGEELDNIKNSGKLTLLFEILKECEEIGDKVLVFSQSLYALNCIEYFLAKVDEATQQNQTEKVGGYKGSWSLGLDYFRLDGSSSCDNRAYWCDSFNNPENTRARLFLISTKAGGLGINLVSANRVIIFDVSWNPSHDLQSIYRVYRFGQIKPSYIYRFVTYGAMEMKIYERQVTKQAISKRVIDEQQIDRHYNQNDLQELYKGDLEPTDRPLPMVPKDVLLGEMLQKYENVIFKYHLHQSLLENKEAEGLNEEERKAAWEEFENEKVLRKTTASSYLGQGVAGVVGIQGMSAQAINSALMNIVRRDNPTWSEHQIKGIIPALVKQLQVQIEEQDMSMYQRVVQEINLMQQAKLKESMYQQQMMKLYQQQYLYQKQQQAVLGNMKLNPQQLQSLYAAPLNPMNQMNYFAGNNQYLNIPSTSSNQRRRPQDVIELND
ncbi:uncharacterized protein XNP isoform X2 [Diabrotica undecimpunctata]|uniref:uncharacterized protein XNP isoform X2 n=1 Tax=Diabrotica undecimpunctata TaxID=50387 RepID=UPI003B6327EE